MCAVLEDAIRCLTGQGYPGHSRRLLAARARAWIVARDQRWPFSFECICEALGIEPSALRRRLLRNHWYRPESAFSDRLEDPHLERRPAGSAA
jgi:hypothetical protein